MDRIPLKIDCSWNAPVLDGCISGKFALLTMNMKCSQFTPSPALPRKRRREYGASHEVRVGKKRGHFLQGRPKSRQVGYGERTWNAPVLDHALDSKENSPLYCLLNRVSNSRYHGKKNYV